MGELRLIYVFASQWVCMVAPRSTKANRTRPLRILVLRLPLAPPSPLSLMVLPSLVPLLLRHLPLLLLQRMRRPPEPTRVPLDPVMQPTPLRVPTQPVQL